jgi:hypothetical protein
MIGRLTVSFSFSTTGRLTLDGRLDEMRRQQAEPSISGRLVSVCAGGFTKFSTKLINEIQGKNLLVIPLPWYLIQTNRVF